MRKRTQFDLRSSRPLRLEPFEDRCLLAAASPVQAPTLFAPPFLQLPTIATPELTQTAVPTINPTGTAALTGANLPKGIGGMALAPSLTPAPGLPMGSLGLIPANSSPSLALNTAGNIGLSSTSAASASLVVTGNASLTTSIPGSFSALVGVTSPASGLGSVGLTASAIGLVSSLTLGLAPLSAVVQLQWSGGVTVAAAATTSPMVAVKLDAQVATLSSITVAVQTQDSQGGSQGIYLQGNGAFSLGGMLAVDIAANSSASGSFLPVNTAALVAGEIYFNWGSAIQDFSDRGDGGQGITVSAVELSPPTSIPAPATIPAAYPETEIPLEGDTEPQSALIPAPTRSDAGPDTMLESSPFVALLPMPAGDLGAGLDDMAGGAEAAIATAGSAAPAGEPRSALDGGTGDAAEDFPILSPASEGALADLLPLDLASLEGDIQTFLEQVEQLGAELSSMLGRMNLSPLLMAVAIAAIAGEIARRQWQRRPRSGPLLAACEGVGVGWFPGLTDPWSAENL